MRISGIRRKMLDKYHLLVFKWTRGAFENFQNASTFFVIEYQVLQFNVNGIKYQFHKEIDYCVRAFNRLLYNIPSRFQEFGEWFKIQEAIFQCWLAFNGKF